MVELKIRPIDSRLVASHPGERRVVTKCSDLIDNHLLKPDPLAKDKIAASLAVRTFTEKAAVLNLGISGH
eukprot:IDg9317t1